MGFLRVFIHYCTKSLRNFTVLLWWWSNLQDSRLIDRARCASNKMDSFIRRKKKFWAKNVQKIRFFGDFTHYCTEWLRNFTVVLRWCSSLQDSRLFDRARCDSNKMDNFSQEKKFWAKKLQKNGFFGVFTHYCTKSLRNFTYCSDDAQTYRIVAPFSVKGERTKIEPQNNSQLLFTISEISRVSWSWFSLCEILAHFPLSYSCFNASIALKLTV